MPRPRIAAKRNPYKIGTVFGASFVIGAETGGNTKAVAIQLKGQGNEDLPVRGAVHAYFSDDAFGNSVIATAPSGAVAIGTDGLLMDQDATPGKKRFLLVSEDDGDIDITIIEAGAKTMYLILIMPDGSLVPSGAIVFA